MKGPHQPHPEGLVSCLSLEDQGPVCEQEPGTAERERTKRQMGGRTSDRIQRQHCKDRAEQATERKTHANPRSAGGWRGRRSREELQGAGKDSAHPVSDAEWRRRGHSCLQPGSTGLPSVPPAVDKSFSHCHLCTSQFCFPKALTLPSKATHVTPQGLSMSGC